MKVNLQKNLKNSWQRIISLFFVFIFVLDANAALKTIAVNPGAYDKEVINILKTKSGSELFNALTQRDEYLPSIIKYSREQKLSDNKRWMLIMSMTKLGGPSVIPHLVSLREGNSWYIRSAVAKSLGILRTTEASDELVAMLDDPSLVVRTIVVDSLGDVANGNNMSVLIKELDAEKNFHKGKSLWIRKHLVDAIAKSGGKRSIPVLISHLDDADTDVSRHSKSNLMALVSYGNPRWDKQRWQKWWKANYSQQNTQ